MSKITFTKEASKDILSVFDMFLDDEGYIIKCSKGKDRRVKTRNGEEIHISEFGGICKGFGIVKNDLNSIVELSDYVKAQEEKKK